MARKSKAETFRELVQAAAKKAELVPCPKCKAKEGSPCKNYKGQRKATCTPRVQIVERWSLNPGPLPDPATAKPMRQATFYELLDSNESEVPK